MYLCVLSERISYPTNFFDIRNCIQPVFLRTGDSWKLLCCLSIRLIVHCEHDITGTPWQIVFNFDTNVILSLKINWLDFENQMPEIIVTTTVHPFLWTRYFPMFWRNFFEYGRNVNLYPWIGQSGFYRSIWPIKTFLVRTWKFFKQMSNLIINMIFFFYFLLKRSKLPCDTMMAIIQHHN